MEVFNELVTVTTIIILSCFLTTDFISEADFRVKLSLCLLGLILLDFIIPCLISLVLVYQVVKLKIRQKLFIKNKETKVEENASN